MHINDSRSNFVTSYTTTNVVNETASIRWYPPKSLDQATIIGQNQSCGCKQAFEDAARNGQSSVVLNLYCPHCHSVRC